MEDLQHRIDALTRQTHDTLAALGIPRRSAPGAGSVLRRRAVPTDPAGLALFIDHTLLKPDAPRAAFEALCDEASRHGFWSVCVNGSRVPLCVARLRGTGVRTVSVVGFPLGASTTATKAFETREAIGAGAEEIDMVLPVGALKEGDLSAVYRDIRGVVDAAGAVPVKVILETGALSDAEKIVACVLAREAGAAFVKTSTGFGFGGATVEDVRLMRAVVGEDVGVKASGGIRSGEDARALLEAGADRLGASASVAVVTGGAGGGSY